MNPNTGTQFGPSRVQILLSARASTPGAQAPAGAKPVAPEGGWTSVLDLATREVFQIMLGTPLEPLPNPQGPRATDFTAMIGLAGQLCGILTFGCSAAAATHIAARMLGIESEELTESVRDALGEICNMVAGNFKAKIAGMSDHCMLSVPMVVTGRDYTLHSLADGEHFEIALALDGMPLWVAVDMHS